MYSSSANAFCVVLSGFDFLAGRLVDACARFWGGVAQGGGSSNTGEGKAAASGEGKDGDVAMAAGEHDVRARVRALIDGLAPPAAAPGSVGPGPCLRIVLFALNYALLLLFCFYFFLAV